MRLNGRKIEGPNEEIIILPRPEEPLVFIARAVLDMSDFERLCPRPIPPIKRMKNGEKIEETDNPAFIAKQDEYGSKHLAYLIIKSLEATEGLEWETVKLGNPSTWLNYETELKEAGLSDMEVKRITLGVMTANCLNETKIEQVRKLFLAEQLERKDLLSRTEGLSITPSGEDANDSE